MKKIYHCCKCGLSLSTETKVKKCPCCGTKMKKVKEARI